MTKPRESDELQRLIAQQATDLAGQRDYWPGSGRHTRAASLDEYEATVRVDEWADPTFQTVWDAWQSIET